MSPNKATKKVIMKRTYICTSQKQNSEKNEAQLYLNVICALY